VGNILTWRQQADSTATLWSYGYDAADQLTRAVQWSTDSTPAILKRYAYTYDPAGNRTSEQIDDAITMATHDSLNRLVSQAPGGAITVAGNLNEPATVRIQGQPAAVDPANVFRGTTPSASGTNDVSRRYCRSRRPLLYRRRPSPPLLRTLSQTLHRPCSRKHPLPDPMTRTKFL